MKTVLRPLAVLAVAAAGAGLVFGGAALPVKQPRPLPPVAAEGRTVTVCPAAATINAVSATSWGTLGLRSLAAGDPVPIPAGKGMTVASADQPMVLVAEGRQSQGSAAAAYESPTGGPDRGLGLARCGAPSTSAWFTGLSGDPGGSGASVRSQLTLINPDAGQAEVDLRFYGPSGPLAAAGGRGVTVPGHSTREVALESLFAGAANPGVEPVGMEVRTSRGRVFTTVRQRASEGAQPAGSDWQTASTEPSPLQVVPGVPDGPGSRELVLTNPGARRTIAKIEVIGPDGTFAPADAAGIDVNAESTVRLPLTRGLNGDIGAVRVTADQPLVAAVLARSSDNPDEADLAVQPSAPELAGSSIAAIAVASGATGAVVVSNNGIRDATVPLRLVDSSGRELMATELPVAAGRSNLWEIKQVDQPAAVQVRTPRDSQLYAGVVLTSGSGPLAGLATAPLSVPEEGTVDVDPEHDPEVGR